MLSAEKRHDLGTDLSFTSFQFDLIQGLAGGPLSEFQQETNRCWVWTNDLHVSAQLETD